MIAELTQRDVDRHFDHLADDVGGRLVVYNNPVFGIDLTAQDLARLATLGAYEAVKQGTTRLGQVIESVQAVRATGSSMRIYAAADLSAPATLAAGFDGLTSTNCWVFPDAFTRLVAAAGKGDLDTMRAISDALAPYAAVVRRCGQPRTVKAALLQRGGAGSRHVRLPYVGLSDEEAADLATAVAATDALLEQIDR
jgi:dihydrodipicolinate synthase/N-acetylneuraminate lyase